MKINKFYLEKIAGLEKQYNGIFYRIGRMGRVNLKIIFSAILSFYLMSNISMGQEFILGGNETRVIPLREGESAIETMEKYRRFNREVRRLKSTDKIDRRDRLNFSRQSEYPVRWYDEGRWYNFGFATGDSMAQYMVPLYEAIIKKILIRPIDFCGTVELFIHDSNYSGEVTSDSCADINGWVGLYENGGWRAGDNECFNSPPLGEELWPGNGTGGYTITLDSSNAMEWVEIDLGEFGYPEVDGPFFIDAYMDRFDDENCWGISAWDDIEMPYHGFKYYDSTGTSGNRGWHIRSFGWDLYAMVEYNEPPYYMIYNIYPLRNTISTEDRKVYIDIFYIDPTGTSGIDSVRLYYSVDSENWLSNPMYRVDADSIKEKWEGTIPGQPSGTEIWWYIQFWYGIGEHQQTFTYYYFIFKPTHPTLFINNGSFPDWILDYYLEGVSEEFGYDVWNSKNSEPGTLELYQNYTTIVEVSAGGPSQCNPDLDTWLNEGNKNLFISGDEYLGSCFYGWSEPVDIQSGEFLYDYLGLDYYVPDINFYENGDQYGISRLLTVEEDVISGYLDSFLDDSLHLNYDPNYEIGVKNWLDGVKAVEGAKVSFWGLTGILDSMGVSNPEADTMATAVYMEHPNGNKTAFFGFDVLSLNTQPNYYWVGIRPEGPLPQTLIWFNVLGSSITTEVILPREFNLHQNYPNPFNPVTTIRYDLPVSGKVELVIYDILGREVGKLVSNWQEVGSHKVLWDASHVASGIYFYRLTVNSPNSMEQGGSLFYEKTKKLVVIK